VAGGLIDYSQRRRREEEKIRKKERKVAGWEDSVHRYGGIREGDPT